MEEVHLFLHSTNIHCIDYLLYKDSVLGTQDKTTNKRDKNPSSCATYFLAEFHIARKETQEERQ